MEAILTYSNDISFDEIKKGIKDLFGLKVKLKKINSSDEVSSIEDRLNRLKTITGLIDDNITDEEVKKIRAKRYAK